MKNLANFQPRFFPAHQESRNHSECVYIYTYICKQSDFYQASLSTWHLLLRVMKNVSINLRFFCKFSQELETFLESFDKIFVIASGTGSSRAIDARPPNGGDGVAKEMLSGRRDMFFVMCQVDTVDG